MSDPAPKPAPLALDAPAVALAGLLDEARRRKAEGWRLVTLTCVENAAPADEAADKAVDEAAPTLDILYHFDKGLTLEHRRLTVARGDAPPSLTGVWACAFLAENEIQDQFGVRFQGLTPDFEGRLYLEPAVRLSPMCRGSLTQAKPKEGA